MFLTAQQGVKISRDIPRDISSEQVDMVINISIERVDMVINKNGNFCLNGDMQKNCGCQSMENYSKLFWSVSRKAQTNLNISKSY